MSGSLGESNPGVDRYASGVDSGTLRRLDTFLELTDDLSHWIASIIRVVVAGHVSNRSARMHQHHTAACLGAHAWHLRIDGHLRPPPSLYRWRSRCRSSEIGCRVWPVIHASTLPAPTPVLRRAGLILRRR